MMLDLQQISGAATEILRTWNFNSSAHMTAGSSIGDNQVLGHISNQDIILQTAVWLDNQFWELFCLLLTLSIPEWWITLWFLEPSVQSPQDLCLSSGSPVF